MTEELRKILLEENLKGSEILQHLKEGDKRRSGKGGRGGRTKKREQRRMLKSRSLHQFVVHSEECHLTRFIEQVGKGDEGLGLL